MRRFQVMCAAGSTALLGACGTVANITVTPSGQSLDLVPRKADCVIEFYRTRPPERPFDEIATLHLEGKKLDAWEAQERMRRRACELGADAVVVTRDYAKMVGPPVVIPGAYGPIVSPGTVRMVMTGSAVSYPDVRASAAARLARDARGITDLSPPQGFSVAMLRVGAPLRSGADPDGATQGEIASGTSIWAQKVTDTACRVRHPDGRAGWVDCGALVFGARRDDERPTPTGSSPSSL